MTDPFQAPFPYFGGKARIADVVWQRLGNVPNYVEPFFGSGAVLLRRPHAPQLETVNDLDGMVANCWRAVQADPEVVARFADAPVFENDLHARHAWLVGRKDTLQERLEGDPDYYDVKIAGWWVWGMACWIGSGFCSGKGPWHVVDGRLVNTGSAGQGVQRPRVHLGDAGRGVQRQAISSIRDWMDALSARLRRVRVCCGDWSRVCGPTPTIHQGLTGVFLDPPYARSSRRPDLYQAQEADVTAAVQTWCREWGTHPLMRIVLCGYEGEYDLPGWEIVPWQAHGGYGSQGNGRARRNAHLERLWCSPNCVQAQVAGETLPLALEGP